MINCRNLPGSPIICCPWYPNFFDNRSTNASPESFNAKIKAFRATSRGVRHITFFLFRLANMYA
ncbi:transposase [Mucilaginibacter oryzae]